MLMSSTYFIIAIVFVLQFKCLMVYLHTIANLKLIIIYTHYFHIVRASPCVVKAY